jgi:hypothetical protein
MGSLLPSQNATVDQSYIDLPNDAEYVLLDQSASRDPVAASTAKESVESDLGTSAGLEFSEGGYPSTATDLRTNPPSALVGGETENGTTLDGQGSANCTVNMTAKSGTGHYYQITAGHCFEPGTYAFYGLSGYNPIANVVDSPVANGVSIHCDCEPIGSINYVTQGTHAAYEDNNVEVDFHSYANVDSDYTNSPIVCNDGEPSYETFGKVICGLIINASVNEKVQGEGISYTVDDMFQVELAAGPIPGDSGGPVYLQGSTMLMGLVTAANMPYMYATKAKYISNIGVNWTIGPD